MSQHQENQPRQRKNIGWVLAALALGAVLVLLGAGLLPGLVALAHPLAGLYFFLMEALFYYIPSNSGILLVSGVCLGLALLLAAVRRFATERLGRPLWTAVEIIWGALAVLALVAQAYLIAFAFLAEKIYFPLLFLACLLIAVLTRRVMKSDAETKREAPVLFFLFFIALYLFLAMVAGHLATPLVHRAAALLGGLSCTGGLTYRVVALVLLWLPFLVFMLRIKRWPGWIGYLIYGPVLISPVALALPTMVAVYFAGALAAVSLTAAARADGHRFIDWPAPKPQALFGRVLVVSLLALNAVVVHYAAYTWHCRPESQSEAVTRVSRTTGVFDLATNGAGDLLIASLREPQGVIAVDLTTGEEREVLDFRQSDGEISRTEPETLLPLDDGRRFLLLVAAAEDETQNRVAVLDDRGNVRRYLDELPQTGISDFVTDGQGRVYVSTEFENRIFVLDEKTLKVVDRFQWGEAETNRIHVEPSLGRIFSLGLWTDPYLRSWDLQNGGETAALAIGTRSWDMAYDPQTKRLFIPRLLSGKVLVVDAQTLRILDRWPVGFGARPAAVDAERRLLYVGNMYDGSVTVFNIDDGRQVFRTHLGGYLKSLHVDARTHRVYAGCTCGIYFLDPDRF